MDNKPIIIGILNVTPDSFSDGGRYTQLDTIIKKAHELRDAGADFIEIGGESTRPGSKPITPTDELERILPAVEALAPIMPIAIDTFRASTARECIIFGARIINDVSGLRYDPEMVKVIAHYGVQCVIMHSKERGDYPYATDSEKNYADVIAEIAAYFQERVIYATENGVSLGRIILDPGMGKFLSHDPQYSWEVLKHLSEFKKYGISEPLLIGVSRKGFLGGSLEARDEISAKVALQAWKDGATYIRTHDVTILRTLLAKESI